MGDLGSFLTPQQKQALLTRYLNPGQVFVYFCDFTTPQKEKYLVIAAKQKDTFYVFIVNSEVNRFIQDRPDLLVSQISLPCITYTFLEHDSFLDCSKVYLLREDEIREQVQNNFNRFVGELTPDTLAAIIRVISQSRTLSRVEQSRIIQALS